MYSEVKFGVSSHWCNCGPAPHHFCSHPLPAAFLSSQISSPLIITTFLPAHATSTVLTPRPWTLLSQSLSICGGSGERGKLAEGMPKVEASLGYICAMLSWRLRGLGSWFHHPTWRVFRFLSLVNDSRQKRDKDASYIGTLLLGVLSTYFWFTSSSQPTPLTLSFIRCLLATRSPYSFQKQ